MRHPWMEAYSQELSSQRIATLRFQFPYMEQRSRRPDPPALCHATVRAAVEEAARLLPRVPLVAGGRSFGGRMTSQAQAKRPLPAVQALAFVGFPLHPAARPSTERAHHLADVRVPMLFLQGTRDELAHLDLLQPLIEGLGARATLKLVSDANHSFHAPARSGHSDRQIIVELAQAFAAWLEPLVSINRE